MDKNQKKFWYVIQAFSGFEAKVVKSLKEYIKLRNMDRFFGNIIVPTEEVVEIKSGVRKKSERKFFPGYILVEMEVNNASWHLVRCVPHVLGFLGGKKDRPVPISDKEVHLIINRLQKLGDKPRPKILFEPGELIRVSDGPFLNFTGTVESVDYDKSRLTVAVLIFGRSTPVELNFVQVEKDTI